MTFYIKVLLTLSVISLGGCIEKDNALTNNENKAQTAYTEDKDGEIVFYDLKKPDAKIHAIAPSPVTQSTFDLVKINDELESYFKIKSDMIGAIKLTKNSNNIDVKLSFNQVESIGDGFLTQFTQEIVDVLKKTSSTLPNAKVEKFQVIQNFDDQSVLDLEFDVGGLLDLKEISNDRVLSMVRVNKTQKTTKAYDFINQSCQNVLNELITTTFCGVSPKVIDNKPYDEETTQITKDESNIAKQETKEDLKTKYERSLSEDQRKALLEVGFEVDL